LVSPDKRSLILQVKSFFDFISRIEATRGAWRWSYATSLRKIIIIKGQATSRKIPKNPYSFIIT